jgi:peptide/nickel transport system permease protein
VGPLIARRLVALVPTLLVVSFVVFSLVTLIPGDASVQLAGGMNATPEKIAEVEEELGLNDPFLVQYWDWLKDAVRLDFGESLVSGQSVSEEIKSLLPVTGSIVLFGVFIGVLIGVPVGLISGMRPGSRTDRGLMFGTTLGIAVPNFWLAMVLITIFAINLGWFPAVGFTRFSDSPTEWLRSVTLPALALAVGVAASMARQVRAAIADTMNSSFIRTSWAKGGTTLNVVGKHAFKNSAIPAVTVLGLQLGALLGGAVLVEQIFSIPGMGTYLLRAVFGLDLPVIQGVAVMFVLIYTILSLLVDISYGLLNPKVRVA